MNDSERTYLGDAYGRETLRDLVADAVAHKEQDSLPLLQRYLGEEIASSEGPGRKVLEKALNLVRDAESLDELWEPFASLANPENPLTLDDLQKRKVEPNDDE